MGPQIRVAILSTKYLDEETGLYYYGYRYYHPDAGRWVSRDLAEEEGGANIFLWCGNDANENYDALGLIIHANCLDKWLDQYVTYSKRRTASFDYYNGRAKAPGLEGLTVERMLNSPTRFTINPFGS